MSFNVFKSPVKPYPESGIFKVPEGKSPAATLNPYSGLSGFVEAAGLMENYQKFPFMDRGHLTGNANNVNANAHVGIWGVNKDINKGITGLPNTVTYGILVVFVIEHYFGAQICVDSVNGKYYIRAQNGSNWQPWQEF